MRPEAQLEPEALDAEPAGRSGRQTQLRGPAVQWFRIGSGHFFLSAAFKDQTSGPIMGEMQSVVVALRWEPIDGQIFGLRADRRAAAGARRAIGRVASVNRGSHETWRLTAGPEVESWLAEARPERPLVGGLEAGSRSLHLVELCSCLTGGVGPSAASESELEALTRYKGLGGRSIHAGEGSFYWFRTYHLAVADRVVLESPDQRISDRPASRWRAEGGAYPPARAVLPGPWRRRAGRATAWMQEENKRPADSFDPQASYLIEGPGPAGLGTGAIDQSGVSLADLPLARFQPFLARLAPLSPWSLGQSGEKEPGLVSLSSRGEDEAGRLAAWYSRVSLVPALAWRYSPPLAHAPQPGELGSV